MKKLPVVSEKTFSSYDDEIRRQIANKTTDKSSIASLKRLKEENPQIERLIMGCNAALVLRLDDPICGEMQVFVTNAILDAYLLLERQLMEDQSKLN